MTVNRFLALMGALCALSGKARAAQSALASLMTLSVSEGCGEGIKSCVGLAQRDLIEEREEMFPETSFASGLAKYRRCILDARNNNNEFIDGHTCTVSAGGRAFVRQDKVALATTCAQGSPATTGSLKFQLPYGIEHSYPVALQRVDLIPNTEKVDSSCIFKLLKDKSGQTVKIRGYPSRQPAPNDTAIGLTRATERIQAISELKTDECWTYAVGKKPVDLVGKIKVDKGKKKHIRAIKISLDDNSIETILANKLRYFELVDTTQCADARTSSSSSTSGSAGDSGVGMQLMFGSYDVHFSGVIARLSGRSAFIAIISLISIIGSFV